MITIYNKEGRPVAGRPFYLNVNGKSIDIECKKIPRVFLFNW